MGECALTGVVRGVLRSTVPHPPAAGVYAPTLLLRINVRAHMFRGDNVSLHLLRSSAAECPLTSAHQCALAFARVSVRSRHSCLPVFLHFPSRLYSAQRLGPSRVCVLLLLCFECASVVYPSMNGSSTLTPVLNFPVNRVCICPSIDMPTAKVTNYSV